MLAVITALQLLPLVLLPCVKWRHGTHGWCVQLVQFPFHVGAEELDRHQTQQRGFFDP